jgi:hypothetical protein
MRFRAVNINRSASMVEMAALDDSTVVSLKRTMCFGMCPAYGMKIFCSGRVEYEGFEYACAYGQRVGRADTREIRRLVEAMVGYRLLRYQWQKGRYSTDARLQSLRSNIVAVF